MAPMSASSRVSSWRRSGARTGPPSARRGRSRHDVGVSARVHHVIEVDVAVDETEVAADQLWSLGATAVEERTNAETGAVVLAAGVAEADVVRMMTGLPRGWRARVVEAQD